MDTDLETALRLSALEASSHAELHVSNQFPSLDRLDQRRTDSIFLAHPFTPKAGTLLQINVLNQFHPRFLEISTQLGGPNSICGYISCAYARLMEEYLISKNLQEAPHLSQSHIDDIHGLLADTMRVDPHLQLAFDCIQTSRSDFHAAALLSQESKVAACSTAATPAVSLPALMSLKDTLRQWVANYEIGKFLTAYATLPTTSFVRCNQFDAIDEATADERPWIESEERRFGSSVSCPYFVQSFLPPATFSPAEWAEQQLVSGPRVLVIDLNGHFTAAIMCRVEETPTLIMFNTTSGRYIDSPSVLWAYDSMFRQA